jgi:hypothetical protein
MSLNEELLNTKTLAARLNKSEATLNQWRVTGEGPEFIRVGRTPLYRPSAVEKWLNSRTVSFTGQTLTTQTPSKRRR